MKKQQVSVKIEGRQEFFGNVYETKEEAKENADMGYSPKECFVEKGDPADGWMNYSKYGFQEDNVKKSGLPC